MATTRKKTTIAGTVLGAILLLVVGAFALDNWAREQVASFVTEKVVEVLQLDSDQPVTVDIAGVSVIAQVLTGRLDEVGVGVDNVTIGDLTGGVRLTANGIPTDLSAPIDEVRVEFSVSEESLQKVAGFLSATAIDSVVLDDAEIQLASQFSVFGFPVDVGVGIEPFAEDGHIGFTPTSVALNGSHATVESLVAKYGPVAESLLTTRSICIARWLPQALALTGVEVRDKNLVITLAANRQIFDDATLALPGNCD